MLSESSALDAALLVLCLLIALCLKWSYSNAIRTGELNAISDTAKKLGAELLSIHKEAATILTALQASNTLAKDNTILDLVNETIFLARHIPDPRNKDLLRVSLSEKQEMFHLSAVADDTSLGNTHLTLVIDHANGSVSLYNNPAQAQIEMHGVSTYTLKEWLESSDLNLPDPKAPQ